jgi:hypothetical protein
MALEVDQFIVLMGIVTAFSCAEDVPASGVGDSFIALLGLARDS